LKKLSALDANFLYSESPKTPNHISSVQIFKPTKNQSIDVFTKGLKELFRSRLHLVPYLTHKLKFTPGNIDHPVWMEDTEFDIDNHFFRIELTAPGSFTQLEEKVAEIHSELMDRSKPLWKIFIITGLEDGKFAYYNQAHHACLDGMAAQAATQTLMDTTPNPTIVTPASEPRTNDENLTELFRLSAENLFKFQLAVPKNTVNFMNSLFRLSKRVIDPDKSSGNLFSIAPPTRFNRSVSRERSYAAGNMSVLEMKAMAKLSCCKLNDIFLAVCAGGLQRYMLRLNELPSRSLIAACPVSLRKPGDISMDNQVTMMGIALATDLSDPLLRLNAITHSSRTAKELIADAAGLQNTEVSLFGLPAFMTSISRIAETIGLADRIRSPMNVLISNVPGPQETLYSNGAKMLTHYPVSIPTHGFGLNITGTSYVNDFCFAITSCAKAVPDATIMRDDIMDAYEELRSVLIPKFIVVEKTIAEEGFADERTDAVSLGSTSTQAEVRVA